MAGSRLVRLMFRGLFGRRQSVTTGRLLVEGLHGQVVIRRDRFGIPHIEAGDDWDAWFALGFCRAQDRAFQAEMQLRVARGDPGRPDRSRGSAHRPFVPADPVPTGG